MKKEILKKFFKILLVYCFIIVINLQAQEWVKTDPIFDPPGNYYTYYGYFVDGKNGWWDVGMAGPGSIWYTSNGGLTWSKQLDSNKVGCYDIKFIDSLHGWFVGRLLPGSDYYILITKDGGKNWCKYTAPVIGCLTFFDSLNGFAGGSDKIYSTTDGGVTWQAQTIEAGVRFGITDIYFVNKNIGWAVGGSSDYWDAGIILNTTDGGKFWKVIEHPSDIIGSAVRFTDSLHGCIVGSPMWGGIIYVTFDGGASWRVHYLKSACLNDVVFTNDSTGWAVGDYGFIWHTNDRGLSWNRIESGTTSDLYRVFFFDEGNVGYIFGANGTLLKYNKIVGVKNDKPLATLLFSLSQNYPNPFNSETIINYQICVSSHVKIKVYDLLGREIAELVNEYKKSGKYSIKWNAVNLTSGIYFYRFSAGTFTHTRKMILLR